ncbi:hypothetical protein BH11BAC4_BH11BAC4_11440 [soil metagenome]
MRLIISLILVTAFFSCNSGNEPDVSNIKFEITTQRFEKDLFSLDTNRMAPQLDQLVAKYPSFAEFFLSRILGADPSWPADSATNYVRSFVIAYRPVYDSAEKLFSDFSTYEKEIKKGLKYVQYYFPEYKAPHKIVTYIGPLDGYGDALTQDNSIAVGLHGHLGKSSSLYNNPTVQEVYATYLLNRFEPSYIAINAMNNIVLDMYPEKNEDQTLVMQMVEKGKRLYMLNKFLPGYDEYKLVGYTDKQLKDCYKHEAQIWDLFVQNNFLQTIDNNIIKNYIGEGPKTQELGDDSPGNIGSFSGLQIVKKYMNKNPGIKLPELMKTSGEKIFREAKYKP